MTKKSAFLLTLVLPLITAFGQTNQGHLVIVGGGLSPDNKEVYSRMIELAGGPDMASFAIIPTASGVPVQSFEYINNFLKSYGVKEHNIHLIPISLKDDKSTKDVDESEWAGNANDETIASSVRNCSAVWFTGGDQMRITKALTNSDGTNTAVLDAVREVYKRGGVIGGTSAGAAIMSEIMIGNGNSLGAMQKGIIKDNGAENVETDAVLLTRGLGLFPEGIVDQHFNQRARIGRLAVAVINSKDRFGLGFGVDENTALFYSASDRKIQAVGGGGVTIVNVAGAEVTYTNGLSELSNLTVSYLENGDTYLVSSGELIPATGKKPTRGNENYSRGNTAQVGLLSANGSTFRDVITINLIDNEASESVSNLTFTDEENAFLLKFTKKPNSQGYYMENAREEDEYSVSDIRLDISPVKVTITKAK